MKKITSLLIQSPIVLTVFTGISAFFSYLAFYPFRRAYTAATFENLFYFGVNYKILLIISQVLGFAVSKGIGIKVVSEMNPAARAKNLMGLLVFSLLCYFLFGLCPAPFNLIFVFFASLPLGLVYGIVLGYLEGRLITDLLVAILTASFIVGSGFAKSIGLFVLNDLNVSRFYMPFVASLIMYLPFCFFVYCLSLVPPPNQNDQKARILRSPMSKFERKEFVNQLRFGIILFVLSYVVLTIFREIRDNFTPEIWKELGDVTTASTFTKTEAPIALFVLAIMVGFTWIKNNVLAFKYIQILMILGGLIIAISTFLFQMGMLSPFWWLSLVGFGGYVAYAMSNSIFSERLIASLKLKGNIGFLITLADYYAYFGSIILLILKNFIAPKLNYLSFFIGISYTISILYIILIALMFKYFTTKQKNI